MSESLDPFLAKMAEKKVELDALDRQMEAAGVTWGEHIVNAGNHVEAVHSTKSKGTRSIG